MPIDIVIKVQVCTIGFARDNALIQIDTETRFFFNISDF